MNQKATLFQRMIWAISDFRIHPFAQREKTSKAFSYFIKLILLVTLVLTIYFHSISLSLFDEFIDFYQKEIPDFSLGNGILSASEVVKIDRDGNTIIINTDYSAEDLANSALEDTKKSDSFILVSKDALNMYVKENETIVLANSILFKNINTNITKQKLANQMNEYMNSIMFKISLFGFLFLAIFIVYFLEKLLSAMFVILIAWIFSSIFGLKMKFKNYFIASMYILTLPIIIEVIAMLVVGKISESTEFIYQILVCVYTFYALRALKLDQILLSNEIRDLKEDLRNGNFTKIKFDENNIDEDENDEGKSNEDNNKKEENK